ncbi:MAG: SRPBCC domain-containing protein [Bacteroidia bacterium]|nr:SRPBCC domain-containing protein [Bacteroidia bacterium]MCF8426594.1 SRPBCC domain-containing protein [Bacteroidia bacterium]MCF8448037.1 SRPBCC domain-containing protein [Bacteroidia bacterium]
MLLNLTVSKTIAITANSQRVWEVLTQPELIKEYLYGTHTETTWAVGTPIVFSGEYEGTSYRDHGTILENTPFQQIRYSYWSGFSGLEDLPENYMEIRYTLHTETNLVTDLTWSQIGFSTQEAYEHSEAGTLQLLEAIKALAEVKAD